MTVRDGVTFHNGSPVDAEAVVAAIEGSLDARESAAAALAGMTFAAVDESTFTVATETPRADVANLLSNRFQFPVYDVDAADAAGEDLDAQIAAGM